MKLGPYATVTGIVLAVAGAIGAIAGILTTTGWLALVGAAVLVAGFILFMLGLARTFRDHQRPTHADDPERSGGERDAERDLTEQADESGVEAIDRQCRDAADEGPW